MTERDYLCRLDVERFNVFRTIVLLSSSLDANNGCLTVCPPHKHKQTTDNKFLDAWSLISYPLQCQWILNTQEGSEVSCDGGLPLAQRTSEPTCILSRKVAEEGCAVG